LQAARRASARTVNAIMTATYWEMGRRIVEFEQAGKARADYGEQLLECLGKDLTARFGRGFGHESLRLFRALYLTYASRSGDQAPPGISKSLIWKSMLPDLAKSKSVIWISRLKALADAFPLSWTHYVRLLHLRNPLARQFYEAEALRGGWTVRQLERQIGTQFYERAALSRNKAAMLRKGERPRPEDTVTPDEEIRSPVVLEFLGLKDEYSETDLEDALIRHLESFLLELGGEFAFVGRQKRLRIDHEWFRIDLLFFHRRLRSLVVIDLKTGPLSHADIGQMHLYLNYARAHWAQPGENPPVGLILCTEQGESLARYALEGLPNKMLVREYKTALPSEQLLAAELARARQSLERRKQGGQ
jgi:predicted nuclease of restriction endonuclease-like (RecB) superfamily